jgi:hypothetical protein
MSPAGWGLLGTVFGAALTTAGNLLQRWLESSTCNKAEREEQAKRTRDERKVAYLRLLTAARGLRFLSQGSAADGTDVDALRTELSSVNYDIELIGSPAVIARAEEVRRKTLDYVDVVTDGRGTAAGNEPTDHQRGAAVAARQAVDDFIKAAQSDLDVAERP